MRLPAADAILRNGKNHAAAAALASFLLAAPLSPDVASTLLPLPIGVPAASARELASGSGSKVNKDPNSLLRLGLPGIPKEMRTVQLKLEESEDQLSRLLVSNSNTAFKEAQKTLKAKSAAIQKAAPADAQDKAGTLLASLQGDVDSIGDALGANQVSKAQGSLKSALKTVSQIEELIASGYKIPVPPSEVCRARLTLRRWHTHDLHTHDLNLDLKSCARTRAEPVAPTHTHTHTHTHTGVATCTCSSS